MFYNPEIDETTPNFYFEKEESRHITKSLRKSLGDTITITNGKGWIFKAKITDANPNRCQVITIEKNHITPPPYYLHLAVAPTKMNDRYEWFLEKATEIGVHEITPLLCDRSVRNSVNIDRFEKIIQSAMKQSNQAFLPKMNASIAFKKFLEQHVGVEKYIAHCEDNQKQEMSKLVMPKQNAIVLIGPEGDFSSSEIILATSKGYTPVSLGANRLRTETAAVMACSIFAILNQ